MFKFLVLLFLAIAVSAVKLNVQEEEEAIFTAAVLGGLGLAALKGTAAAGTGFALKSWFGW